MSAYSIYCTSVHVCAIVSDKRELSSNSLLENAGSQQSHPPSLARCSALLWSSTELTLESGAISVEDWRRRRVEIAFSSLTSTTFDQIDTATLWSTPPNLPRLLAPLSARTKQHYEKTTNSGIEESN